MSTDRVLLIMAVIEPIIAIVVFVVGVRALNFSSPKRERRKPPLPAAKPRPYVVRTAGRRD
jgi:hypothetical protein